MRSQTQVVAYLVCRAYELALGVRYLARRRDVPVKLAGPGRGPDVVTALAGVVVHPRNLAAGFEELRRGTGADRGQEVGAWSSATSEGDARSDDRCPGVCGVRPLVRNARRARYLVCSPSSGVRWLTTSPVVLDATQEWPQPSHM